MKKFLILLVLAFSTPLVVTQTGCSTTQQAQSVVTLEIVGQTAQTAMNASATLLKNGQITVAQWTKIATIYDTQFQPAYAIAVTAAQSNLSSIASPDLVTLAGQIAALAATFIPTK